MFIGIKQIREINTQYTLLQTVLVVKKGERSKTGGREDDRFFPRDAY